LTFAIGLAVGVVIAGLLGRASQDPPAATGPSAPPSAVASPTPSAVNPADPSAGAQVNAACLRVIDDAREVHDILAGVGEATADVDLQRLDDMVRELQPIEPRLGSDLRDCDVEARLGSTSSTDSPSPTPTGSQPSPTG
jgi:hypothetical protein